MTTTLTDAEVRTGLTATGSVATIYLSVGLAGTEVPPAARLLT